MQARNERPPPTDDFAKKFGWAQPPPKRGTGRVSAKDIIVTYPPNRNGESQSTLRLRADILQIKQQVRRGGVKL